MYTVPPVAIQVDIRTDLRNPPRTPTELIQGSNIPAENTPMIGPLITPPMIMAASSIMGMNLMRKVMLYPNNPKIDEKTFVNKAC